jgi:menaquinone-9 beta-reductase
MAEKTYDIITVGGGLGGSALAKAMAERGARVLVVERERQFKDRVRGEWMAPWGVAEARALGIDELLRDTCGHELPGWDMYLGPMSLGHRDLVTTTALGVPAFGLYHPAMQEVLLQAAADVGVEVYRGAVVRNVRPGALPTIEIEREGQVREVQARLVVGVDGRASLVRKWANFAVQQDPQRLQIAGVLFEEMTAPPEDASQIVFNPSLGQTAYLFPQGGGRVRAYIVNHKETHRRLQGAGDVPHFIEEAVQAGAAADFYTGARAVGPLATFDGADTWVEHPYKDGIGLVGDAAAASDPTWGQGLSLTLRDVRVLRDQLLAHENWDLAGHAYAEAHDRHYGAIHTVDNWFTEILLATGPEAEARRAKALPLLAQDGTRVPDHQFGGPDLPLDETVRRRFFGEE